jgi:hypothetical protein
MTSQRPPTIIALITTPVGECLGGERPLAHLQIGTETLRWVHRVDVTARAEEPCEWVLTLCLGQGSDGMRVQTLQPGTLRDALALELDHVSFAEEPIGNGALADRLVGALNRFLTGEDE